MVMQNSPSSPDPIELKLQELLRPVRPSQTFVQTVRKRIQVTPSIRLQQKSPQVRRYLMILGGVLSASLLLITGVRAIFYLVNRSKA
ncbi:MAG: hypothetical protein DDG60_11680 [Anaerolineae bacterium]|nr:MAG: hypothetical protein DDG60_11680 [Anaerolineae bacterium]